MLKKRIFQTVLVSSILLVAACDSEEQPSEPDNEEPIDNDEPDETPADDQTPDEDPTEDENDDENDDDDLADDNDDSDEDEVQEYLYEVSENYAYINVMEGKEANERVALLTYDDAPDTYSLEIAEILQEYDAPAIFFVNGMYIQDEEGRDALKQIYDMGFEIGNHTQTHANLQTISEEQQYEEIIQTSDLVEEITGERPRFFRAPHGANTDYSIQTVLDEGMTLMNWTYGYDYFEPYMDGEKLAQAMITGEAPEIDIDYSLLVPGSNLLLHDREWTMEATPAIIEGLRADDYELLDPKLIRPVDYHSQAEGEDTNE